MNVRVNKSYIYILLSFIFVLIIYTFASQLSIVYSESIVPAGDPFSYELNLIRLNNESSTNLILYAKNIFKTIVSSQWYYAYKIPIAIFSPFINNDHHNFAIINYTYFLICLIALNYSLNSISKNLKINFFSSLVICFLPWMWGYKSIISLHQISLDTQVYLVGLAYFALLIRCFFNSYDKKSLLFAAILGGLFTWTRGNAFAYFFTLTFPLITIFLIRFWNFSAKKKKIILKNLFKPFLIFLGIFGWFVLFTHRSLINYYATQQNTINYNELNIEQILNGLKIILFNFPGAFFTSSNYGKLNLDNIFFSLFFYLLLFFGLIYFFKNKKKNLVNTKIFYLIGISLLTIIFLKFFELYNIPFYANGIHVAQTQIISLIPFSLTLVFITNYFFQKFNRKLNIFYFLYFLIIIIYSTIHGFINTNFTAPKKFNANLVKENYFKRVANPIELEKFAINLDKNISNPKVYTLLYNFYNPVIINYYRERKNLNTIQRNWTWESDVIAPFISDPNHRGGVNNFKSSFKNILKDADYIIMPKIIEDYKYMNNIIASQFYDNLYEILNSPTSPKYEVIEELNDVFDLVLLKKANGNDNSNIYDGKKKNYKNVKMDINIFKLSKKSFWHQFKNIKSYDDLLDFEKIKKILISKNVSFPALNLFDNNLDTFWEKNVKEQKILIGFEKDIDINQITLFTENRKLKSEENYHGQSIERVPSSILIKGSNNLETWDYIAEMKNISFNDEKATFIFANEKKYNFYLINMSNDEKILRLYQIYFNNDKTPNFFKEVK